MLCSDDGDRLMTLAIGSGAANAAFVCGAAEVMARSFPPGAVARITERRPFSALSWPHDLWSSCRCQGRALPSPQAERSPERAALFGIACRDAVIR